MTARPVAELQRAWAALQAGQFQQEPTGPGSSSSREHRDPGAGGEVPVWDPGHPVLPVLGAHGSAGATTLALALATAALAPARVLEACPVTTSGLIGCATAELGDVGGWLRGCRDAVVVDRQGGVHTGPGEIPLPAPAPDQVSLTVLDPGWDANQLYLAQGWLTRAAWPGDGPVVVVTTPRIPGLRRAEQLLRLLADDTEPVLAVTGPHPRRWAKTVRHAMGDRTRELSEQQRLVTVPDDPSLALHGPDTTDLPAALVAAATHLLELTELEPTPRRRPRGPHA